MAVNNRVVVSNNNAFTGQQGQVASGRERELPGGSYEDAQTSVPDGRVLGDDSDFIDSTTAAFNIDINNTDNIIKRVIRNIGYSKETLSKFASDVIYELLPKKIVYPDAPPVSGKVYCAGWARILKYGAVIDPDKNPIIDSIMEWAEVNANGEVVDQNIAGNWLEGHAWPRDSTMDPTYLFFTQDPAIFYVKNPISHIDPDTGRSVPIDDNDIVWYKGGKEIHRGWFLELDELEPTIQIIANTPVIIPDIITIEINNAKGSIQEEIKFCCIDSDDNDIMSRNSISEVDNFTSTLEGRFKVDTENKGVEWFDDPRYDARQMFTRFRWKHLGKAKHEAHLRKFKGNVKIYVDGVVVFSGKANQLDGERSGLGAFLNTFIKPGLAALGGLGRIVTSQAVKAADKKGLFTGVFNDNGDVIEDGRSLEARSITDWTDGRKSALLYKPADDNEWNALVMFNKKPGPFTCKVEYKYSYRSGLFNWGKKWNRTYSREVNYTDAQLNLDTPLAPIDMGIFTINYSDERDKK
tara:strand:- start:8156 stop:9721 length:1566 start_codon:yes stop_codon:yes gene_type:complete